MNVEWGGVQQLFGIFGDGGGGGLVVGWQFEGKIGI